MSLVLNNNKAKQNYTAPVQPSKEQPINQNNINYEQVNLLHQKRMFSCYGMRHLTQNRTKWILLLEFYTFFSCFFTRFHECFSIDILGREWTLHLNIIKIILNNTNSTHLFKLFSYDIMNLFHFYVFGKYNLKLSTKEKKSSKILYFWVNSPS